MFKPADAPDCFGTHLWSPTDKECVGGPDPGYTHPQTGVHTRERCRFYSACASASAQSRTQNVAPVQSLIRSPSAPSTPQYHQAIPIPNFVGVQPPPRPAPVSSALPPRPPPMQATAPMYQYQPSQYSQPMPGGLVPPYIAQQGPQFVPMPYQQFGSQMPGYLTVPEPMRPGDTILSALGRTVLRSMLKAFGHSLGSFFDHTPLRPHTPPDQKQ